MEMLPTRTNPGGAHIVYRTQWRGETVAVKMMREGIPPEHLARIQADFLRELYSLASLRSPHLVLNTANNNSF